MTLIKRIAFLIAVGIASGIPALFIAGALSDHGLIGTCFEGACGYAAIFYAFPFIWLIIYVALLMVWTKWRDRK